VGGGLAGLAAAGRLAELGISSRLFDMGTRAPGGRTCSRTVPQIGIGFDHGCQFLAPASEEFAAAARDFAGAGAVAEWRGALGELRPGSGMFHERQRAATGGEPGFCGLMSAPGAVYRGQPSMGAVAARSDVTAGAGT
jgi:predicted NAD/FAD-dependent oxidoreductase